VYAYTNTHLKTCQRFLRIELLSLIDAESVYLPKNFWE